MESNAETQKKSHPHSRVSAPLGVLLVNLGTPDGPTPSQVRAYLREFLMDPYVVDINRFARWLLVHGIILPTRPKRSAEAYAKVWTDRGSPLLFHLKDLVAAVSDRLGPGYHVVGGMRYGHPSLRQGFEALAKAGVQSTKVIPLYPQYSLAATQSSMVACRQAAREVSPSMEIAFQPAFYSNPAFLDAFASRAKAALSGFSADHTLFSFHGLPERQVARTDPTGEHCLKSESCCEKISGLNQDCYRAQCFETARGIARRMGLPVGSYTVCFQSRLGRTPWIKPYTDIIYGELARRGVRRVAVLCPAFVADCLETLEEVAIRGREQFRELGGEELLLVPSLNSESAWVQTVAEMARDRPSQSRGLS